MQGILIALMYAHRGDNGNFMLPEQSESIIRLFFGAADTSQPVMMSQTVEAELKRRMLTAAPQYINDIFIEQRGIRKYQSDINIFFGQSFYDLFKIFSYKRLPSGYADLIHAVFGKFVCHTQTIGKRELRMMRIGSGHQAMTAAEIAFSRDAPVNGSYIAGTKNLISLP